MKPTLPTILAVALSIAIVGSASAGVSVPPSPPAVPMAQTVAVQEMTVSNRYGYANLRDKPSTSGKLLDRLTEGTKVVVIEKVSGGAWFHVKAGDKVGYIKTDLLK